MKKKNIFESVREVKWCPGCGNYSILMSMQKALSELNIKQENTVFVSGIGCSGRFPYYINTYGFHTLHGRAPAIATGLKMVRPDLNIWIVIGDGDGFSIGLNHLIHMVRRNVNVKILFINNKIYALTKGQYSPTSKKKSVTKSSPFGSVENEIKPLSMMLNSGCTFVARAIDSEIKNLKNIIKAASIHNGSTFIEVLQNCNVFNDKIYDNLKDRENRSEIILDINNKEELRFGHKKEKYLGIKNYAHPKLEIIYENEIDKYIIPKYDLESKNIFQIMLSELDYHHTPFPLGIFRKINETPYEKKIKITS